MDVQKKYLPRSFRTAHAPIVQYHAVSFHHTRQQPHRRRQSPVAGLYHPQYRPT
jgi:hypothetical protein